MFSCSQQPEETAPKNSRVEKLPYFNEATFTPIWKDKVDQGFHSIPQFSLINQNNKTITNNTVDGKIYVANFFFSSCPGICPKMATNMVHLQEEFETDDDILLLSHSVTPKTDRVPVLKRYAERNGVIDGKWHLLTGDKNEIYTLGRTVYFVEEDLGLEKSVDEFLHTENFVLVDVNGHLRGIYNGLNKTDVNQLIADIKTLKKEI